MGAIIYTAKRSLILGHVANTVYTIDVDCTESIRGSNVQKTVRRSLGGKMEVLRDFADKEYQITFAPVAGVALERLREFLDSTDAGESFAIDIYGNASRVRTMRRTDDGYSEQPFMRNGSEVTDHFTVSITAIEA